MRFSILVPVYNVEEYIGQCVDSLLSQTYNGEYEIILVDDGSTDKSGEICDRYAEEYPKRIKVIHKENHGVVAARENGIVAAQGDICLFVDSDDFAENNLLEEVDSVFMRDSDTDMVMYSFSYFTKGCKHPKTNTLSLTEKVFDETNKEEIYSALILSTAVIPLWNKAIKTDILRSDPTDYSLFYDKKMAEDWFQSIYLFSAAKKIIYINKPLYNYRTNLQSVSRSFNVETIDKNNILYVYDRFMEFLPQWGMDTPENREKLNARWLNETMYTFSKYMENAGSIGDVRAILNYDWLSMLPEEAANNPNEHENKTYRKLLEKIKRKEYTYIILFFAKKKAVKKIRDLKSKVLRK